MKTLSLLLVCFSTFILGCDNCDMSNSQSNVLESEQPPVKPIERITLSETDQIYEAVVLYLLSTKPWSEYLGDTTTRRFLKIDEKDPSPELQARLAICGPGLRPGSKCISTMDRVFEKDSKNPAVLCSMRRLLTTSHSPYNIHFSLKSVGWGSSAKLTVEKVEGFWKVTSVSDIRKG